MQLHVRSGEGDVALLALVDELHDTARKQLAPELAWPRAPHDFGEHVQLPAHEERPQQATSIRVYEHKILVDVGDDARVWRQRHAAPPSAELAHERGAVVAVALDASVDDDAPAAGTRLLEGRELAARLQRLRDVVAVAAEARVREEGQVLHEAARLALRSLDWAQHSAVRGTQLPGLGQLAVAVDGRVDSPQVR